MTTTYSGRVIGVARIGDSVSGDQQWLLRLDDKSAFVFAAAAQFNYSLIEADYLNRWVRLTLNEDHRIVAVTVLGVHATPVPARTVAEQEADRRYPGNHNVEDPFGETGEAQSDPYGYEEYAQQAFLAGVEWQRQQVQQERLAEVEKLVHEVGLLWDARISQGQVFLNHPEDVHAMRRIMETRQTRWLNEVLRDTAVQSLCDAADAATDPAQTDTDGMSLGGEERHQLDLWLRARAAKVLRGELEAL